MFVEGAFSGGTEHACETLDGLTARPVRVRLLPFWASNVLSRSIGLDIVNAETYDLVSFADVFKHRQIGPEQSGPFVF